MPEYTTPEAPLPVIMEDPILHTAMNPFCGNPLCLCYQETPDEDIQAYNDRMFNYRHALYMARLKHQTAFF